MPEAEHINPRAEDVYAGARRIPTASLSTDIGFVFALHQEAVGILDRLKHSRKTRGNGQTFHTGTSGDLTIAVILSGVGQNNAEAATKILTEVFEPKLVCSAGYAGGLSSRLKQFNLCIPEQALRASDGSVLDLSSPVPQITPPVPDKLTLITVNEVVELPEQKRTLHEQTGAEIVDMETFAIADVWRTRNIPFCSIRIILDAAGDRIPRDIAKILDNMDKGVSRFSGTIFGSILSRPSVVLDLVALKQRAFTATERLAQFALKELQQRRETLPVEKLIATAR
jgi:adenosylhomocysteine nucleosidase